MKKPIGLFVIILYSLGIFINSNFALCCCESIQTNNQDVMNHEHENFSGHHHDDENTLEESNHNEKENHCSNSPRENIQFLVTNENLNIKLIEFKKLKTYVTDSLSVWLAFLITNQFNHREFVFRPPIDSYALNLPLYEPQSTILRI